MLAVAACAAGLPAAALADGGLGFRVDSDSGLAMQGGFITLSGSPGDTVSGSFIITNTQRAPVKLSVYPSDGLTSDNTGVVYSDANDEVTDAGAWIRPDRNAASMTGHSEQPVHFTATIPAGTQPGDHVGGVVLEQTRPGSTANGTVNQVVRNVVPVMIEVTGPAAPQIAVLDANLTTLPGTSLLAVTVKMSNVGLKLCKPLLTIAMGDSTDTGQQVVRQLDTVLPGDTIPYPLPWPKNITPGSHLVHVTVSNCGASKSITATVRTPKSLTDEDPAKATTPIKNSVNTNATPGTTTFTPGKTSGSSGNGTHHHKHHKSASGTGGAVASGGPTVATPTVKPTPPSSGGGKKHEGWFSRAAHAVSRAVTHHAPEVLARATIPASILGLIGLIFFAQEAIDRRDPKLALAPLHREQDLAFDSDPLRTRPVVPSPTGLAVDG